MGQFGKVLKTTDGGENWSETPIETPNLLSRVVIVSGSMAYISSRSSVFKTTNTGATWNAVKLPPIDLIFGISFLNENTGIVASIRSSILKTTTGGSVKIKQTGHYIPSNFVLYQNYPNPFNPSTNIKFDIKSVSDVKLSIYNVAGKEVAVLVSQKLNAGSYSVTWNTAGYSSGVYFYRLQADGFSQSKRMVLIK